MRRVVNSQEVTHLWAHRRQDEARNGGGSLFFESDTIYSYGRHFPIARHLPDGSIAVTTRGYSTTTAGHISMVRQAIPSGKKLWFVADPEMSATASQAADIEREMQDMLMWSLRPRIRQATRDAERAAALRLAEQFNGYAAAVGSATRVSTEAFENTDTEQLRQVIAARDRAEREAAAEAERLAGIRLSDSVAAWKRGDLGVSAYDIRNAPVALRINPNGRGTYRTGGLLPDHGSAGLPEIETSRHASIPVADAKRLWPVIQRTRSGDRDYEVGMQLGDYRLTKIRRDGSIVVGCHDIAYDELRRIAVLLGLVEQEAGVPA